jgi:predicted Zn-dependent protease
MNLILKIVVVVFIIYYFKNEFNNDNSLQNNDSAELSVSQIRGDIYDFRIRALGDVERSDLEDALRILENFYGYRCKIESRVEISSEMRIDGTDEIINSHEALKALKEYEKTIFIVDKRLWSSGTYYRGYTNGTTVIVRGDKSIMKETLLHEIGHTLGLGHCDNLSCIMAVNNDQWETGNFCEKCKRQLNINK